jgi:hypothetical protein
VVLVLRLVNNIVQSIRCLNPCFVRMSMTIRLFDHLIDLVRLIGKENRARTIHHFNHVQLASTILVSIVNRIHRDSTYFLQIRRKPLRTNENDEILIDNTTKYRKKLQAGITQINRTKKFVQKNFDNSDCDIHGSVDRSIDSQYY